MLKNIKVLWIIADKIYKQQGDNVTKKLKSIDQIKSEFDCKESEIEPGHIFFNDFYTVCIVPDMVCYFGTEIEVKDEKVRKTNGHSGDYVSTITPNYVYSSKFFV